MKPASHMRLASKGLGDDTTLTRFVRVDRGEANTLKRGPQPRPRAARDVPAFVTERRTKYTSRVLPPSEMRALLVSGHSNVKIGRDVRKGRLKGSWIYTLSLEERKTCPSACTHWRDCYGNNMPFAKRVDHTSPDFLLRLDAEIAGLVAKHKRGVLIRLHALGDFYSTAYVDFWWEQLRKHPSLAIYGYTAHPWHSTIGQRLQLIHDEFGDRMMVRNSDGDRDRMATVSIKDKADAPAGSFVCPEQTAQTQCCATCGACWGTTKNVSFIGH